MAIIRVSPKAVSDYRRTLDSLSRLVCDRGGKDVRFERHWSHAMAEYVQAVKAVCREG
jgi:hypothetical protein